MRGRPSSLAALGAVARAAALAWLALSGGRAYATPAPEAAPGSAPEPFSDSGFFVGTGPAFGLRNLPNLSVGAELLGHVEPRRFVPVEFGAIYFAQNRAELSDNARDLGLSTQLLVPYPPDGSAVRFDLMQVWAALCPWTKPLSPGSLFLCGGIHAGLLSATSEGFTEPEDSSSPVMAFEAYARFAFPLLRPFGVAYSLGLFVPVFRDSFRYLNSAGQEEEVFRLPPVGGRLDVIVTFAP